MSKVKLLVLIAMLGALAMLSVPAYAQVCSTGFYDPTLAAPYAVPYAAYYEAGSTTGGTGGFFTDPFFAGGCGPCGVGGGVFENTAASTMNYVTAIGLPPLRGLWFGCF